MGTPEVSGNQGLRDQVEALKTVQVQILSISKAICQRPLETDRMDLLKALDKFKIKNFSYCHLGNQYVHKSIFYKLWMNVSINFVNSLSNNLFTTVFSVYLPSKLLSHYSDCDILVWR